MTLNSDHGTRSRLKLISLVSLAITITGLGFWLLNTNNSSQEATITSSPSHATTKEPNEIKITKTDEIENQALLKGTFKRAIRVKPIPVDLDVVNLNPDLVGLREADLIRQVVSNSIHDEQINNAAEIVARTNNSSLRSNIIRALGRRHNDEAQLALRNIYDAGVTENESALILGSIKPKDLDDPATDWILTKLNRNELSESTNRQMMAKLLIVSRYSGLNSPGVPPELLSKVDVHWHDLLQDVYQSSARRK